MNDIEIKRLDWSNVHFNSPCSREKAKLSAENSKRVEHKLYTYKSF